MDISTSGLFSGTQGSGKIAATAFFPGALTEHHRRHHNEFDPPLAIEEYEAQAKQFFCSDPTKTTAWFYDVDDVLYRYDKKTNEFGICTLNGIIITYFLPEEGITYWWRQVQKYAI
jgi:pyocin large subunit-like protein